MTEIRLVVISLIFTIENNSDIFDIAFSKILKLENISKFSESLLQTTNWLSKHS